MIVLIFKIGYIILRVPSTEEIDFNDDAQILFDKKKSKRKKKKKKKKKRFEDAEKLKMEFESKLSSIAISGNKANK